MYTAYHRSNSDFHLKYFLAGTCYTPDAAYFRLLMEQEVLVEKIEINKQTHDYKFKIAQAKIDEASKTSERLEAEQELKELEIRETMYQKTYEAALKELETLNNLIDQLKPQCKYIDMNSDDAWNATQREEWLYEIKARIENGLISTKNISVSDLEIARRHPDFKLEIAPFVDKLITKLNGMGTLNSVIANLDLLPSSVIAESLMIGRTDPVAVPLIEVKYDTK
jgi:hypothetical protein